MSLPYGAKKGQVESRIPSSYSLGDKGLRRKANSAVRGDAPGRGPSNFSMQHIGAHMFTLG